MIEKHVEKQFKNLDEQVEIFKHKGMTINDDKYAKQILLRENYFFLNGYRSPFLVTGSKRFVDGATFEELYSLFKFDRYFRNIIFKNVLNTAKAFQEYEVKKGDFVTICAAGIPETVYSFYALSILGGVSNMISPYFDKNDLIERIEDCKSDILVVMDIFYDEIKDSIQNL